MKTYNPLAIEKKWQKRWFASADFRAKNAGKNKFYLMFEFPYPSGDGLHVGHCRPYIGLDVIARKKRMDGKNLLFPMGWDAFGLPTENYAIKKGIHPAVATKKNTENFKKQMKMLGLSLDWSREINTTDPKYYKWTQWIFTELFKKGLAYKDKININWCPSCKTGLANEEVVNGTCERCGTQVEKREKEQWLIKITKYADRLIKDLERVDYPKRVVDQQVNWIGRSGGARIAFPISNTSASISVFTTRPDTLFGCTFLVLAPEHPMVKNLETRISNVEEVKQYIAEAKNKSDLQRQEQKEKTGVELKGVKAINPANKKEIPVFIADYVMVQYGTGAIMAVPGHDERDFEFAVKYNLPTICVIDPLPLETLVVKPQSQGKISQEEIAEEKEKSQQWRDDVLAGKIAYMGEGPLVNSGQFSGMGSEKAKWEITKEVGGEKTVQYKLRDWIFSRQHYWGEPIPMIHCNGCGWVAVPEKDLPVTLPKVTKYQPTDTGESPLSAIGKWVNVKCPQCGGKARRETDTMPNWAGSNWYFLRYVDPKNNKALADKKLLQYWMPVDWYNGGMEHTTLHLLYSRFIFKFLHDIGAVPKGVGVEPYKKRTSHGIILGPGGIKMSKSRGNVINPDDVASQYGADTLRVYEMFMGPFEQMIPWDEKGIIGARRFLEKVHSLAQAKPPKTENKELAQLLDKTIKKVGEDIEAMKFNTAISALMTFANEWHVAPGGLQKKEAAKFLTILSPFAPHLAEELWRENGFKGQCSKQKWPSYGKIVESKITLVVSVNGKVRDTMEMKAGLEQAEVEKFVFASPKVKPWVEGKKIQKIIFVKNKLINFVI